MRTLQPFAYYPLLVILSLCVACGSNSEEISQQVITAEPLMEKAPKHLRHVVIFKFKDDANPEDVERLNQAFHTLADSISVVQDFEWGLNNSPEGLHQDFTHCYLLTFASEADRDSVYAPHPLHQAFVASLQPHLEKAFVVDYWTNP